MNEVTGTWPEITQDFKNANKPKMTRKDKIIYFGISLLIISCIYFVFQVFSLKKQVSEVDGKIANATSTKVVQELLNVNEAGVSGFTQAVFSSLQQIEQLTNNKAK